MNILKGYSLVIVAACLWGLIGPVAKVALTGGMEPFEIAFWRTALAWVMFAAHSLALRQTRIAARDLPLVLGFGVLGVAGLFGCYAEAVQAGGAALSAVLLYTAPAWVAVMARLFFHEPMDGAKVLAVALTILGAAGVSGVLSGGAGPSVGPRAITFGLLSGFTYALYYIFGKKFENTYATPTLFLYAMPVGALAMTPFFSFSAAPASAWWACVCLALCSTYGAYSIYYAGLKHLEATRAAVAATLEPIVAAALAYAWYGETFNIPGYIGSALILSAVLLSVVDSARRRARLRRAVAEI